jgi:hypothetical protein
MRSVGPVLAEGEIFVMTPGGYRDWDPHTSYHLDGRLHVKATARRASLRRSVSR